MGISERCLDQLGLTHSKLMPMLQLSAIRNLTTRLGARRSCKTCSERKDKQHVALPNIPSTPLIFLAQSSNYVKYKHANTPSNYKKNYTGTEEKR